MSLLFFASLFFVSCNEEISMTEENTNPPAISNFEPQSGPVGTEVKIFGENLQKVNSVTIGDGAATVKYLISPTQMVVVVTQECTTGTITAKNIYGSSQTTDVFTKTYPTPVVTSYPTSAKPNDEMLIEGNNLNVVTKVNFGTTEAEIISQDVQNILVKVPYFENSPVAISLVYSDGTTEKTVSTAANFDLITPQPVVTNTPISAEIGTTIEIIGENLSIVTDAWFGEYKATVLPQSDTSIKVTIPSDFTATTIVPFTLTYYGTKEITVTSTFQVIVPDISTIYYWQNVTTYCQDPSTTQNFFNADNGEIYTPCDYAGNKEKITFFVSISSSLFQLNNPNNSGNQTKNFKCNNVNLPTEVMPTIIRFRTLKADNEADNKYIQLVKNKQLDIISKEILIADGVNCATGTANTPRFEQASGFVTGDVILFMKLNRVIGLAPDEIKPEDIVKVGFIEVVTVNFLAAPDANKSNWTFNCYYQK